jgi:hypothetical protein
MSEPGKDQEKAFDGDKYVVELPQEEYVTFRVKKRLVELDLPTDPRGSRVKGNWAGTIVEDKRTIERDGRRVRVFVVEVDGMDVEG